MNASNLKDTELDENLSAFFKAELPDPFPALRLPEGQNAPMPATVSPAAPRRDRLILRSRLSLAMSAALLIGGCWYISGQMGSSSGHATVGKGGAETAQPSKELIKARKEAAKNPAMP